MKLFPWVKGKKATGWDNVSEWRRWLLDEIAINESEERIIGEYLDRLECELYPLMVEMENDRAEAIDLLKEAVKILKANSTSIETYHRIIGPATELIKKAGEE